MKLSSKSVQSNYLRDECHALIPGGCHTYAKGDDQFPELAPRFITHGRGCRVWDVDGNEYIEYGMGLRSVTLGHAFPTVIEAVKEQILLGSNFTRPTTIEIDCARRFLSVVKNGEQVKFTKDGSTAVTAAARLARAYTGRDMVAVCADHPFFSYDDWFIGTTEMNAGIPKVISELTVTFRYNDVASVERLMNLYSGKIACLILEPSRGEEPVDGFLERTREICQRNGVLFVLDESITGFRYHLGGGQAYFGIDPDLSIFGKALANGFALSALTGKREYMRLGGLQHDRERVFLLSTTHGSETHALAAGIATIDTYCTYPVVDHLYQQGTKLADAFRKSSTDLGLCKYVGVMGKECNLSYYTRDAALQPSQAFRSLFLQETIKRGVLMPSLVTSYSHDDDAIEHTIQAIRESLEVYRAALCNGVQKYLVGHHTKAVLRRYN